MKIFYDKVDDMYLFTNANDIFNVNKNEIAAIFNFNNKYWYHFSALGTGDISDCSAAIEHRNQLYEISIIDFYKSIDFYNINSNIKEFYIWLINNSSNDDEIRIHKYIVSFFEKILRIIKMNNLLK